jgi:hypothetical protein
VGRRNRPQQQPGLPATSVQRFNQPDPYDGSYNLTDPQSFNRYAYTQNDPVNFVDPSGLNAISPGTSFGSGILWTVWYGNNTDGWRIWNQWFEPYGGDFTGTDPQNPQEPPGPPDYVNSTAVKACAEKLFGITLAGLDYQPGNGRISFQGFDAKQSSMFDSSAGWLYITPNNSRSSSQITAATNAAMRGGVAFGETDPNDPSHPYVANDITGSMHYGFFVHELGNALAFLTGKYHKSWLTGKFIYDDPKIEPNPRQVSAAGHNDPGVTFEDCVRNYKP